MLTENDYLEITQEPVETIIYYDRPLLYVSSHQGKNYLVNLVDDSATTERFLLVEYTEATYALLNEGKITIREFFIHPSNIVHNVVLEFTGNGVEKVLLAETYEDSFTIPDSDLPTKDAPWNSNS